MKTKLHKHIAELQQHKYKLLFGKTPRLMVDLMDGDCQVCFTDYSDYINLDEAIDNLHHLAFILYDIQCEVDKIRAKAEEKRND